MNLLNCIQINELLSAYLESELDPTTTLQVANHLEKCPSCEKELNNLITVSNLVKSAIKEADKADLSLATRASKINSNFKAQIASSISLTKTKTESSTKNSMGIPNQPTEKTRNNVVELKKRGHWLNWGKKLFLSLAASVIILFLSFFTLSYYATATGPMFTGVARNHQFCNFIEMANLGVHKGYSVENLLKANNIELPNLDKEGIQFSDLHPCQIYKAHLLHMMYIKGDKQISVYYGSEEALSKLQETIKDVVPGKLYLEQESNLQIGAISTTDKNLWLIAGDLTKEEITNISLELSKTSSPPTQESRLY